MKALKPTELKFWQQYLSTLPSHLHPNDPFVESGYCGNKESTDELLELYLCGKKTAGSGLVQDYKVAGDPLPQVGDYWIILDSQDTPRCIVKTLRVVFNLFGNVPHEIVLAEGEGDLSVEYWKKVHASLYEPFLDKWGIRDINQAEVVTEFFEVVYSPMH